MGDANVTSRVLDFDLSDLEAIGPDLISHLNAIREASAVFWSDIQKGWFVTRYADVSEGFTGKLPLSNVRLDKVAFAAIPEREWSTRIPLLTSGTPTFANMTDPPYHSKLRRPMNAAFGAANIQKLQTFVKSRLQLLLDEAEARGRFEFIEAIARPLTGSVIMKLMGMPDHVLDKLGDWANTIVSAIGTPNPSVALLEDGERAMREMDTVFMQEIERRKTLPQSDFLTVLADASKPADGLTHPELLGTCVNTLLAGHESTASTMAMGVAALAEHPDQVRYMLQHPERKAQTVEEISRFVAMSASQTRVASADFQWHDANIRKGDIVYLWMGASHRDPRVFNNPDVLDLSRDAKENLVFGRGIHHCVGHFLAKLQLGEFFPAMFERFDVEVLDHPLNYSGGYAFRTLSTLNVRVKPASHRRSAA
ncbi:MAG: cytochrome P450 [Steroidobacteraceae bacterium]